MTPLVTLAVTTLNRPRYLPEALSSALAQDYPNLEILVSDNGSSDHTPELVRSLTAGDPRVRLRRNEKTVPVHEHFTQCVEAARGDYFMILHDDDRLNARCVSELVAVATRHPDVNVVVPANVTIDEEGGIRQRLPTPDGELFDGPEFALDWLCRRTPQVFACVNTVLARRDVIRHFGGYQSWARGQNIDNLVFLQCAITGRVGFAHNAVFNWRVYNGSYGVTASPRDIAVSSRQFVDHLRNDPTTRQALAALPAWRQKQIVDGVRIMTAKEFLLRINFYNQPFRWDSFRQLFSFYFDTHYISLVLRHYYNQLRGTA